MKRPGRLLFDFRHMLILLLAGWLLFNLVQSIRYVAADYSPLPVEDYWRVAEQWADLHSVHWANLWRQHNEHRIVFPELLFMADMFFLHGRLYLPIVASGVCYLGVGCVLIQAAYSQKLMPWPQREIALLLAGVVMSWKACSSVIAAPFQLQFTLLQLASALSFYFLSKLADSGRRVYLFFVIAGSVLCTFTSGNGILMWVVVIAGAAVLSVSGRQIAILGAAGVLFIGAFFFHYQFLPSAVGTSIRHPLQALAFLCSYFSMPFGESRSPPLGIAIGAANLLGMAVCAFLAWRRHLLRSRLSIVLFGIYVFTFLSALLTTGGRLLLTDSVFDRAKAWRYVTMPTVSWALLSIALVWLVGTFHPRWPPLAAISLAVFFAFGFLATTDWVETTRGDSANAQMTAMMLLNGVFDPGQVRTIFPDADRVHEFSRVLRQSRKSIYSRGGDQWIGRSLLALPVSKTPVNGQITRVVPVPGGLEILGWADATSLSGDHAILFVNQENRIVGFGRRPGPGLPFGVSTWDTPNPFSFAGYVSLAMPIDRFSVYVQTFHGKSVQPLGQKVMVPAFTQVDTESDNAVVPGVRWSSDPGWRLDGYPVKPENGRAPHTAGYGNYSESTPKIVAAQTAPFVTPSDDCLILPVLHGVPAYGQSVEVRDADTSRTIAELPFVDGRSIWERWRIPIPSSSRQLIISAEAAGTGPNEWLAMAMPERCVSAGQ